MIYATRKCRKDVQTYIKLNTFTADLHGLLLFSEREQKNPKTTLLVTDSFFFLSRFVSRSLDLIATRLKLYVAVALKLPVQLKNSLDSLHIRALLMDRESV